MKILRTLGVILLVLVVSAAAGLLINRTNGKIVSSGETRRYLLHVPRNLDQSEPVPLVITIHGFAQWPANHMSVSQWNPIADREGFIVVYPSGTGFPKRWLAFPQQEFASSKDVMFISDLIDTLSAQYNIDLSRIYVNGLSNGGGMTFLLGCELADRIAATGTVAGAFVLPMEQCAASRPMPLIAFHGTADPIVPFQGGPSRGFDLPFPYIPQWMAARAELNDCGPTPLALPANGEVNGVRYTGCLEDAEVIFYTIEGGGHTWPGGNPLPKSIAGYTSMDISASETMWAFFEQYTLP
jgi:polyhydroxybutyrate depolymerase